MTTQRAPLWRPTFAQKLLLKACLLEDKAAALTAWHEWRSVADFKNLDPPSSRLLPLLYRSLRRHSVPEAALEIPKQKYVQTWQKNHFLFRSVFDQLGTFRKAGIPTLLLKGAALVLLHYKDLALRPMADIDVLVPPEQAASAMDLLRRAGWRLPWKRSNAEVMFTHYAVGFTHESGAQIDLHWHVLDQSRAKNADARFWDHAIRAAYGDIETRTLDATDTLFHVCVHAATGDEPGCIRWVADALTILQSTAVDWNRLLEEGKNRRFVAPLKETLQGLRQEFEAPIPHKVLRELQAMPVSKRERDRYKAKDRVLEIPKAPHDPRWLWRRHVEIAHYKEVKAGLAHFLTLLQLRWTLPHLWQVPFHALSLIFRRIQERVFPHADKSKL